MMLTLDTGALLALAAWFAWLLAVLTVLTLIVTPGDEAPSEYATHHDMTVIVGPDTVIYPHPSKESDNG